MKNITIKELTLLGKDMKNAQALVLYKHGFTCKEIACALSIPESVVRNLVNTCENKENNG